MVTIDTAGAYIEGIQAAVGDLLLSEEGATGAPYSERVTRGQQAYDEWIAEHGVEFDPQFGVDAGQGPDRARRHVRLVRRRRHGQGRAAEQPDPAYADSLPAPTPAAADRPRWVSPRPANGSSSSSR